VFFSEISIETVYLIVLILSGISIFLYVLFGDFLEVTGEFFNPTLILAFITMASASGYVFETYTSLDSVLILVISMVMAFIMDACLNMFVLIPLSSAEESLAYTEESLKGRVGKVITPIPVDGYGEVIIENASGRIAKPAVGFKNIAIQEGTNVLIMDVKKGVLQVTVYDDLY
jgi:membrane protein implicated in regulation of membrane protease activity